MRHTINKVVLWLLSAGSAISVATIYLSQPLLHVLQAQFHVSLHEVGFVVTCTQIGYTFGILFLIPLGDIFNKKRLIQIKLVAILMCLMLSGFANTFMLFFLASFMLGIAATAAQDFIPLAADLAHESERGKTVGIVMSGLLLGILLSRTISGIIAHHFGWRAVFFFIAALTAIIGLLISSQVPSQPSQTQLKYTKLLHSTWDLFVKNRLLQLSILTQGMVGVIFSCFWTVLTFYLSSSPFYLSTTDIGLFGLAGAGGAIIAPLAGKWADKKGPLLNIKCAIFLIFLSFCLMWAWQKSIIMLIIGTILFDLGVQTSLISHQTIIYSMPANARSRINALFITGMFLFFSMGSFLGSIIFSYYNWNGIICFSLVCAGIAFLAHLSLAPRYQLIFKQKNGV